MAYDFDIRTTDMPDDMHLLLNEYHRDGWSAHPGFHEKTRHWLAAHRMFKQLAAAVTTDTETYLHRNHDPEDYAARLSYRGNALVWNLHGHHGWEDHNFFPELSASDPRFDAGLDILESDHAALDLVLDHFTQTANRSLKLLQLDQCP